MRHIHPPLWLLLSALLMTALHHYAPLGRITGWLGTISSGFGFGFVAISLLLFGWAVKQFMVQKTTIIPFHKSTALIKSGPFRWSRNPIYLSMVLLLTGIAFFPGSLTPLLVPPLFAILIKRLFIQREEQMLRDQFGECYQQYCRDVPRWFWFV